MIAVWRVQYGYTTDNRQQVGPAMRFLLRFLSLVALTLGVLAGVIDAIQSVASGRLVLTPLEDAWRDVNPSSFETVAIWVAAAAPALKLDEGLAALVAQPAAGVLLGLSLLFYVIAYRPNRDGRTRRHRFAWR